jgi:hypothetical protein
VSNDRKLDIQDLSLDDLLGGLADRTSPAPKTTDTIATWLVDQGIFPGTTRVLAKDLYLEYRFWRVKHPEITGKVPELRVWGKQMAGRFKKGRGKQGFHYYISRNSQPDLPPEMCEMGTRQKK